MSPVGSLLFRLSLIVATIALNGVPVSAHDLWIEPTTFSPGLGETVGIQLRVGENLLGDPVPRDTTRINQFVVEDATGRKPVIGRHGDDPAGFVQVAAPGLLVIGYNSKPSAIELAADKFNQYLKDEGLDAITALRAKHNKTDAKARELFSRCVKSLLLSGPPSEAQGDRPLGFILELVAERNPYTLRADKDLPVLLTYKNRPLANALVVAMNEQNPSEKQAARTDKDGRVRFRLQPGGMWLIKTVHMVPAAAGANAEWESFWASLTFAPQIGNAQGK